MNDTRTAKFQPETGQVRLEHADGAQIVFCLTTEGVVVWCKRHKREVLIPWPLFMGWKAAIGS